MTYFTIQQLRTRAGTALCALLVVAFARANAQGTLSTQGFGYPVGGYSTRTAGTAGAFGEFDLLSPRNPASLGGLQRSVFTAQAEPEFRSLSIDGVGERSRVQRIPLLLAAFALPRNMGASLGASTLLDRTFSTVTTGTAELGDETVTTQDFYSSHGAMSDLSAALGYRINPRVTVGISGHLIMGSNDVALTRVFDDTTRFGSVVDSSTVEFTGTAITVGADVNVTSTLALSASYRMGNEITARERKVVQSRATVPSRAGASVRYTGIAGSVFALAVEQVQWSKLSSLATSNVSTSDAVNVMIGAEVAGQRLRGWPVQYRAGYARNQLPFGVNGEQVMEHRISAGLGLPVAQELGSIDLSIQRAMRRLSGSGAREDAWLLGIGLQIRPL